MMSLRYAKLFVMVGILLVSVAENHAVEEREPLALEGDKAVHGVINTLTFPLEWPMQWYKARNQGMDGLKKNPSLSRFVSGVWGAIGTGTHKAAGRVVVGVYQIGGFWLLNPATNHGFGLPLEGEFAFDFDEPSEISFNTGLNLVGNKVSRGLLNLYWGIVGEVPGKTLAGLKNGTPIRGFVKGSWYMMSRVWQGTFDTAGFLLPNYSETTGYVFDIDDPWKKEPITEDDIQFSSTD